MSASVPTEEDWGNWKDDLDQKYAHGLFAGKTNEEMQPHFQRCVIERADEIRWMLKIPFQYYILGFRDHVMSGDFDEYGSPDAASCFLNLVEEKLKSHPDYIFPVMQELMPAVKHVAHNQSTYDADVGIYGDFLETFERIDTRYKEIAKIPQLKRKQLKMKDEMAE